jgi:hypothetical protein
MDSSFNVRQESWMPYDEQEYFTVEKRDASRLSSCMNDDDYDYAIELKMDDEYRQAADALPNIAEVADVDDDELLVLLDERRQENATESSNNELPQRRGIVKYIRESLSMHGTRRDSTYSFNDYQTGNNNRVLSVIPSPLRPSDQNDIEEGEMETSHISTNRNDARTDSPKSKAHLPETATELENGNAFEIDSSSHYKSNTTSKSAAGWGYSISSLWGWSLNRKNVNRSASDDTLSDSDRAAVGKEPEAESESESAQSNPVTALFEPASLPSLLSVKYNSSNSTRGKESKGPGSIEISDSGKRKNRARRGGGGGGSQSRCTASYATLFSFSSTLLTHTTFLPFYFPSHPPFHSRHTFNYPSPRYGCGCDQVRPPRAVPRVEVPRYTDMGQTGETLHCLAFPLPLMMH